MTMKLTIGKALFVVIIITLVVGEIFFQKELQISAQTIKNTGEILLQGVHDSLSNLFVEIPGAIMRGSERYNDIKEWIRAEENTHTVKALIIILIGIGLAGIVFTFGGIMDAIRYQKSNPREKKVKERRRKKSPPKKAVPQPSIPEQKAENESFGYASIEELILNNAEVNDKIDSLASYMGSIDARLERLEAEVLKNMRMKYVEEATREKQIL